MPLWHSLSFTSNRAIYRLHQNVARPALTERRKAQTRREIAEHALELFVRNGYSAVGADAIADAAGVSLRTFYRYFSGKDEVLELWRESHGEPGKTSDPASLGALPNRARPKCAVDR